MAKSKSNIAGSDDAAPDTFGPVPEDDQPIAHIADAEVVLQPSRVDEPAVEAAPQSPIPTPPRRENRRGGFIPLVLGGAIAAGLGAGASLYLLPGGWRSDTTVADTVAALSARVDAQQTALAALPTTDSSSTEIESIKANIATLTDAQKAAVADTAAATSHLSDTVTALDARLTALEQNPATGDAATTSAVAAFRREVDALKAEVAAQQTIAATAQGDIAKAAEAAAARIKDAEAQAAQLRAAADADARNAAAKTALNHLSSAIDSGAPLQPALDELTAAGMAIPSAIVDVRDGVPSNDALKLSFTAAARDALTVALTESAPATWTGRVTAFLRAETGARSLVPRDGDDPDAILSRAEAALNAGDLPTSLTELEKLPPGGKARMADWVHLAQQRIDVQVAVAALAATLK